jgi:hypothetical protein
MLFAEASATRIANSSPPEPRIDAHVREDVIAVAHDPVSVPRETVEPRFRLAGIVVEEFDELSWIAHGERVQHHAANRSFRNCFEPLRSNTRGPIFSLSSARSRKLILPHLTLTPGHIRTRTLVYRAVVAFSRSLPEFRYVHRSSHSEHTCYAHDRRMSVWPWLGRGPTSIFN